MITVIKFTYIHILEICCHVVQFIIIIRIFVKVFIYIYVYVVNKPFNLPDVAE
jgi:hypothetical protein